MTEPITMPLDGREGLLQISRNEYDHQADSASTRSFVQEYADVLGVKVSAINMKLALDMADQWIAAGAPGYVCVSAVHAVMEAQGDAEFRRILNDATINTPDGMPLTWVGRLQGHRHMDRVYGPEFMLQMCRHSVERGYRHFFYGGKPGVAEHLRECLQRRFPGLQVVGARTSPFKTTNPGEYRKLTPEEEMELIAQVRESRPHILWVGLGAPRQERFMAQFFQQFQVPLLVGVGAAFDYHTGRLRESPEWMKRSGLQWLHRLSQDPRRLWKRYLLLNPAFLWQIGLQFAGLRHSH